MTTPPKTILFFVALIFGSHSFLVAADDHDGHDHKGHDHSHEKKESAKGSDSAESFTISDAHRNEIGLDTHVVEMREIAGGTDAVIAVPISSVVEIAGKIYVFAQSGEKENSFERWEITTGANNDQFVEAVTGVFPGDTLVSSGSVSLARIQNGTYETVAAEDNAVENGPVEEAQPPIAAPSAVVADVRPRETTSCQFTRNQTEFSTECDHRVTTRHFFHDHSPGYEFVNDYHDHSHGYHGHIQTPPPPIYHHSHHDHYHGW